MTLRRCCDCDRKTGKSKSMVDGGVIGVRVRANCCCLLLDKGGKPKTKNENFSKFHVFDFYF